MNYKCFKGNFTGISNVKDLVFNVGKYNFYNFYWSYIKITDINPIEEYIAENEKIGDYYHTKRIISKKSFFRPFYWETRKPEIIFKKDTFWIEYVNISFPKLKKRPEVFIPISEKNYFNEDLFEVVIKDVKIDSDSDTYHKKEFIELTGTIYFKIKLPEVKKIVQPISPQIGTNRSEKIIEVNPNHKTVFENSSISHENTSNENNFESIIKPQPINTFFPNFSSKFLGIFFGVILWLVLLAFFNLILPQYFIFALIGAIGWIISRFLNSSALKTVFNIIFAALFLVFLSNLLSNNGSMIDPTVPKKDGNIKVNTPKEKKSKTGDDSDYEITKEINWYDFITNKYGVKYNTYVKSFFETQKNHNLVDEKIRNTSSNALNYYNKLYRNLEQFDNEKTDSIVNLLKEKAAAKKLNSIQTAEMVVTFIQEIPYVLVHENSCQNIVQSESRNSFIVEYHQHKKPCLPNIAGGVQSPYEFLHNLKGDCDTRSLLGYTILKKLNISTSIWISEAYGHSILGVGLPVGNGVYKTINGINHYGVELTSKGFRLGMIAPQQRDMSNWDIALYSNTFK